MNIKTIAVMGAGTMGHGIAEVSAIAGFEVYLRDINQQILSRAIDNIKWSLEKLHEKGQLREDPNQVLARIHATLDISEAVRVADFMIEAAFEDIDVKRQIFMEADKHAPPHAILATNTSSLPISEIASFTSRPQAVIGMHFFNPPPIMKLVEVVMGDKTSRETLDATLSLAKRMGKEPVVVNKDVPGFIANRVFLRLADSACFMVERGEATIQAIDSAARHVLGFPMGIFELMDFVGIDVMDFIAKAMAARGVNRIPCNLIGEKVRAKEIGLKAGKGFYSYPAPGKYARADIPRDAGQSINVVRLLASPINEAAWLLREGIATRDDIDKTMRLGFNMPKGILEYADEFGIDMVVKELNDLLAASHHDAFQPDSLLQRMISQGRLGVKTGLGFYPHPYEKKLGTVILRVNPPIAWVELNRPEKRNALSPQVIEDLENVIGEIEKMPSDLARVVVIRGNGKSFCAGADISIFKGLKPSDALIFSNRLQGLYNRIEMLPKPVIASIHGHALGGGLELALACDIRIAADDAVLGLPEITLGIIPGAGGTQRLARLIGIGKAKELILTGDTITGREAAEIGLVNKAVHIDKLQEETELLASKLAERPPVGLMLAKRLVNESLDESLRNGLSAEAEGFAVVFSTSDSQEGVSAFLERRKPSFRGE
ncbi:MAG: 3-hydroxyacyl-CoA dehydrogenase NAD-binding domain-containing protein [Thermocladium sp.]|jgi:enoyl-CoA hydratase/3-hydroxyacyl-CoA dehydrogenase|nr:MAG: 3-hydroxyacyl-CoA dehydrogenase [Thermocladium sp. ECH_B]